MRTLLLIGLSLFCLGTQAQEKKRHYADNVVQARVYLSNDSVYDGLLMNPTMHAHYINSPLFSSTDDFVAIKGYGTGLFAKKKKWAEAEVDVNESYAGDEAFVPDHRVFMMRLFQGKTVSAYLFFDLVLGQRVAYYRPGMSEAHALFKFNGKLTDKRRETLKQEFSEYPELVSFIDTMDAKDLTTDNEPIRAYAEPHAAGREQGYPQRLRQCGGIEPHG